MSRGKDERPADRQIRLRSATRGRQRWEVRPIRRNPALARQLEAVLAQVPGVTRVEANPISSRVLIIHSIGHSAGGPGLDIGEVIRTFLESAGPVRGAPAPFGSDRSMALARILKVCLPKRRELAAPVMLSIAGQTVHILQGLSFVATLNTANGKGPGLLRRIGFGKSRSGVIFMTGLTAALAAADAWLQDRRANAWAKLARETENRLRGRLIVRVEKQDLEFFDRNTSGRLMNVVIDDAGRIGDFVEQAGDQIIEKGLTLIVSGTLLAAASPRLALLAILPVPIFLISSRFLGPKRGQYYAGLGAESGRRSDMLEDNLLGIADVKSFTAEREEARRFRASDARVKELSLKASAAGIAQSNMARGIISVGFTLVAGYGGMLRVSGKISGDEYVRVVYWFSPLMSALTGIGDITRPYYRAASSAQEIVEVLKSRPRVVSGPTRIQAASTRGEIVFDNVSFGYQPGVRVLDNVSFQLRPGETLGVVGPTGSGKSTLIRLLLRFYDVESGRILLDGRDIRELHLRDLRSAVSLVNQDVYLFEGTVLKNVLYGQPHASSAEVEQAMRNAGALSLIETLPAGLESEVGERGRRLSGGERQRVAIARALIKGAPVLALDEATSHLDYETEFAVKRSLRNAAAGRGMIMIAHRLSTVRNADRIIVLEAGKICEMGSHQELVALGGRYASLWRLQNGDDRP